MGSYFDKRRQELGIASGGDTSGALSSDYFQQRKMDLGLIPDTRPTMSQQFQQQFGGAFPSFDEAQTPLMKQIAQNPPPMITSDPEDQARAADAADTRPDLRTDYPGGWLNPVNDINQFRKTSVGQAIDRFAQGAGHAMGVPDEMMSSPATTGNNIADKILDFAGGTTGYMVNPAMPVGNLGVLQNFFEHPAINNAAAAVGNRAQSLLPDAGMTISRDGTQIVDSLLGQTVNKAAQGVVRNGLGAAAFSPFHTIETGGDVSDIPRNMLEEGLTGAALGGAIEGLSPSASRVLEMIRGRNAEPTPMDQNVYDQAAQERNVSQEQNPYVGQGQDFADRFNFVNQRTGAYPSDIPQLPPGRFAEAQARAEGTAQPPGESPIATPYTFGLPEASDATVAHQNNVHDAFGAISEIDDNLRQLESHYQQEINDQYQLLKSQRDNRGGVQQGQLIRDTTGDVIGRTGRISDNPEWYQDFYAKNGRRPTNKDLYNLAKEHVDNGYRDGGADIPAWVDENSYHQTRASLQQARDEISGWVKEKGLGITDAKLKGQEFGRTRASEKPDITQNQLRSEQGKQYAPDVEMIPRKKNSAVPNGRTGAKRVGRVVNGPSFTEAKPEPAQELNQRSTRQQGPMNEPVQHMASSASTSATPMASSGAKVKPIARRDITQGIRKRFGVTVRFGRLGPVPDTVAGYFKTNSEVIRSRRTHDISVIAHELGHNLDKRYKFDDQRYTPEILKMLRKQGIINMEAYQPHQLHEEGVAEFMRLLLTDPALAQKEAPNFYRYFMDKTKNIAGKIADTQKDIQRWVDQGEAEQFRGQINRTGRDSNMSLSDRISAKIDETYTDLVDKLHPLAVTEKEITGKISSAENSLYKQARLFAGAPRKAMLILQDMKQILKPIDDHGYSLKDVGDYAAAVHAKELEDQGIKSGFTQKQIDAVIKKFGSPEMEKVRKQLVMYNNNLLDMLVHGGLLKQEAVDAMRQKYPNYVPFYRFFDEDMTGSAGFGGKGFANLTNPVKRLKGSDKDVIDPLESMIKNTFAVVNAVERNKVGLQLAKLADVEGAGKFVERLSGKDTSAKEQILTVWVNGEKQQFQVEPTLYRAIMNLNEDVAGKLTKIFSAPASLLRAGATLTPDFALRNPIRDQFQAYVVSNFGYNPIIDLPMGMFHVLRGKLGKNGDALYDQWVREGGSYGNYLSMDRDYLRKNLEELKKEGNPWARRTVAIVNPKQWIELLRAIGEFSEEATKMGEFRRGIRKGYSPAEAAYQARDLMDFGRVGNNVKQINRVMTFLNANIQGKDRIARAFKNNPVRTTSKAIAAVTFPTIAAYMWNRYAANDKQKETITNAPIWLRNTFYFVAVPGTDVVARIPKPQDLSPVFSNLPENILRYIDNNDPQSIEDFTKSALQDQFSMPWMLTGIQPVIENLANYNFFTGGPVVPRKEQSLQKPDQYDVNTSLTARGIGQLTGQSPMMIDNLIQGYGAGLGKYTTAGLDQLLAATGYGNRPPQAEKRVSEYPVINAFTVNTNGGGKVMNDFYQKLDDMTNAKNSNKKNNVIDGNVLGQQMMMQRSALAISQIRKQYQAIQDNRDLSPADKRAKLDELNQQMKNIAAQALQFATK